MMVVVVVMIMMMDLEDGFLSLRNLRTILLTVSTFPFTLSGFEEDSLCYWRHNYSHIFRLI